MFILFRFNLQSNQFIAVDLKMSSKSGCCVCDDPASNDNPILTCEGCAIRVHMNCYGSEQQIEQWKCSPCRLEKTRFIRCRLCLSKGGAMKQTLCQNWVHIICALFTGGVRFADVDTMEPIDISTVSSTKRNKRCSFCFSSQGFANLCSKSKCPERLHITCAQKENCLKEVVNPTDDTIKFRAYCKNHKPQPIDSGRRLSAESIKGALDKNRKKKLAKNSIALNADWILEAVSSNKRAHEESGAIEL